MDNNIKNSKDILPLVDRVILLENGRADSVGINPQRLLGKYHQALLSAESELSLLKQENETHKGNVLKIINLDLENERLKKEVREFAEWASEEGWKFLPNKTWSLEKWTGIHVQYFYVTTEELHQIFKEGK
jgi:hypothetical protein